MLCELYFNTSQGPLGENMASKQMLVEGLQPAAIISRQHVEDPCWVSSPRLT